MGWFGRFLGLKRVTQGSSKLSEIKVDPGAGANITCPQFNSPGDDSHPLDTDFLAIISIPRSRGSSGAVVGVADILNDKKSQPGDKRIYARQTNGGEISEIWLKNDGTIVITNGNGTFTMVPGGTVNINGATIDTGGNISTPGTITASGAISSSTSVTAPTVNGTTDVVFGGKSAGTHAHGNVENGPDTSGPPV